MATDIVARGMAAGKLDKNGGEIAGNLSIGGNLTVNGTTITRRQETLLVKDNMLITNSDGLDLMGLSGLGIRDGSTDVYGLVYNNSSSAVEFGVGTLDSHNNFTFNAGEGHPIAIRENSSAFTDDHLVKWNASSSMFVDGGSIGAIPNQKPFNPQWRNSTFTSLMDDVYADTTVAAGDVYVGTVFGGTTGGMPFDGNAEVTIEVNTINRIVMHCIVTSSNVSPYHWECQVVAGHIYPWRSWILESPDGTNQLLLNNSSKINNLYLDMDTTITQNSAKPITSGAVYNAIVSALNTPV